MYLPILLLALLAIIILPRTNRREDASNSCSYNHPSRGGMTDEDVERLSWFHPGWKD